MKKMFVFLMIGIMMFTISSNLFAVSEAAVLFLLISPGARAAGMGESFVALADDGTAVYWNPAGLAFQDGREVTFMHANWLPQLVSDMAYEFFAYRQYVESLGGTIGGNVTYLNLGENVWTGETGEELGTFNSGDMAVSICYGTKLNENLGIGVSMRYIRSMLAPDNIKVGTQTGGTGQAFAVDLGVLYRFPFLPSLAFGANLSNLGPKITYIDERQADPIPTNLKLGFAYHVMNTEFNRLSITMDTNKLMVVRHSNEVYDEDQDSTVTETTSDPFYKALITAWTNESLSDQLNKMISSIGVEYGYNNMIFLRAGYYYDQEGQVKYPSFGAGLQYAAFRFDFAYVAAEQGHPLSDTMRFSLTAKF